MPNSIITFQKHAFIPENAFPTVFKTWHFGLKNKDPPPDGRVKVIEPFGYPRKYGTLSI